MRNVSDIEAGFLRAAVVQAHTQPGIRVILDIPDSDRRVLAETNEIGVDYQVIENAEVIEAGAVSNAWFRTMKEKGKEA